MRPRPLAAHLLLALAASLALACQPAAAPAALQPAPSATSQAPAVQPATAQVASGQPAAAEGTTLGDAEVPCYRVLPLDEKRRTIECKNGDRFTIGRAADGRWYQEMKVRAGVVPGYESPEAAGKALCACGS